MAAFSKNFMVPAVMSYKYLFQIKSVVAAAASSRFLTCTAKDFNVSLHLSLCCMSMCFTTEFLRVALSCEPCGLVTGELWSIALLS